MPMTRAHGSKKLHPFERYGFFDRERTKFIPYRGDIANFDNREGNAYELKTAITHHLALYCADSEIFMAVMSG